MTSLSSFEIHGILVTEANRQKLPEAYKNDLLVHDLDALYETGTQRFLWVLRTCGTHLVPLDKSESGNGRNYTLAAYALTNLGDERVLYYIFEDGLLTRYDKEQFTQVAAQLRLRKGTR